MKINQFNEELNKTRQKKIEELNIGQAGAAVGAMGQKVKQGVKNVGSSVKQAGQDFKNNMQQASKSAAEAGANKEYGKSQVNRDASLKQQTILNKEKELRKYINNFLVYIQKNDPVNTNKAQAARAAYQRALEQYKGFKQEQTKNESILDILFSEDVQTSVDDNMIKYFEKIYKLMADARPGNQEDIKQLTKYYKAYDSVKQGKINTNKTEESKVTDYKELLKSDWSKDHYLFVLRNNPTSDQNPNWEKLIKQGFNKDDVDQLLDKIKDKGDGDMRIKESKEILEKMKEKAPDPIDNTSQPEDPDGDPNEFTVKFKDGETATKKEVKKMISSFFESKNIFEQMLFEVELMNDEYKIRKAFHDWVFKELVPKNKKKNLENFLKNKKDVVKKEFAKYAKENKVLDDDLISQFMGQDEPEEPEKKPKKKSEENISNDNIDFENEKDIKAQKSHAGKIKIGNYALTDDDIEELYKTISSQLSESLNEANVPDNFIDYLKDISEHPFITDLNALKKSISNLNIAQKNILQKGYPELYKDLKTNKPDEEEISLRSPEVKKGAQRLAKALSKTSPEKSQMYLQKMLMALAKNNDESLTKIKDVITLDSIKDMINYLGNINESIFPFDILLYFTEEQFLKTALQVADDMFII